MGGPRNRGVETVNEDWSGRADLNRRPLAPQASALPGCATSRQEENPQRKEPGLRAEFYTKLRCSAFDGLPG